MSAPMLGFIGLGNMGGAIAANLARAGHRIVVHDTAGEARAPAGAEWAGSVSAVAAAVATLFLCLPDGAAAAAVTAAALETKGRALRTVVDLSTIGIAAAERLASRCAAADLAYADAPVSGGVAGARAGTVAIMVAAPQALYDALAPTLGAFGRPFHVGTRPGQGQAMKLLNNFLSATAMTATSEAIAFGERRGLAMRTMLEVLNAATGRNTATSEKFPHRVLTGTYDAGFANTLMTKDLRLYLEALAGAGGEASVAHAVVALMERFLAAAPGEDFTRIYPFVRAGSARP
ncbi:MAG: NAD(P)-dependent oxidoreductase [Alphaproteobacteria bacterium]|nr:NAD(P)-dependent oxidoreductase [Alphaproteobacteria bacterium]